MNNEGLFKYRASVTRDNPCIFSPVFKQLIESQNCLQNLLTSGEQTPPEDGETCMLCFYEIFLQLLNLAEWGG